MKRESTKRAASPNQPRLRIHFLGAAESVTGSLFLVERIGKEKTVRFLVDVGQHQGEEEFDQKRRLPRGITADMIDFVLITHAHIDHSGYLPKLINDGFKGFAYTHSATLDLLRILLPDSGRLQQARAFEQNEARMLLPPNKRGPRARALYTARQAKDSLQRIKTVEYDKPFTLAGDIEVLFTEAQHILGSAVVTITIGKGPQQRVLCFNGNIGRENMTLLKPLKAVKRADVLIAESTYGGVLHDKRDRLQALADVINKAYARARKPHPKHGHGVILIPAFAIGRVQAVLYDLRTLMAQKRIPVIPVFLDSPMAQAATDVYRAHPELFCDEAKALVTRGIDPILPPVYAACKKASISRLLDANNNKPVIIIGSSGMAAGGRIRGHIEKRLPGAQNTIVFCGHQEPGALGHVLTSERPAVVDFDGREVRCNATVELLTDYSGHADYEESIEWMRQFEKQPRITFLVHGEPEGLTAFQEHIRKQLGWKVRIPTQGQVFDIS